MDKIESKYLIFDKLFECVKLSCEKELIENKKTKKVKIFDLLTRAISSCFFSESNLVNLANRITMSPI